MKLNRRRFCKQAGVALLLAHTPPLFARSGVDESLSRLYPGEVLEWDDGIQLRAPQIAENGSVVPLDIQFEKSGLRWLSIVLANEPINTPIWCEIFDSPVTRFSTRIRMSKTGPLAVVLATDHTLYYRWQEVKVTQGGSCG